MHLLPFLQEEDGAKGRETMNRNFLIVIGILLLAALILGSELKSIVPELLKVEKAQKYEVSLAAR